MGTVKPLPSAFVPALTNIRARWPGARVRFVPRGAWAGAAEADDIVGADVGGTGADGGGVAGEGAGAGEDGVAGDGAGAGEDGMAGDGAEDGVVEDGTGA